MAYPPPPGTNSLPARPPASSSPAPRAGFKPAFNPAQQQPSTQTFGPSAPPAGFGPQGYPAAPGRGQYDRPSYSAYPSAGAGRGRGMSSAPAYSSYGSQPQTYGTQPTSYGAQNPGQAAYGAPQIRNPFPTPVAGQQAATAPSGYASTDYEPDMAAQIAQWQSAYGGGDLMTAKDGKPTTPTVNSPAPDAVGASADPEKKKTVARQGGGKKWTDDSLLEWDPSHLRLFVGNLAGETTDESLLKAFAGWKSVQKARVVRDKRTTKSKGFGFVSFSDADDFFQAAKEMNGKYIQSHPVVIRKANTEIKVTNAKQKNDRGRNKNKNKGQHHGGNGSGSGGGAGHGYEPHLGPAAGSGVVKPGQTTKNGLRLLG